MGVVIKCANIYHGKNRKLFVYQTTATQLLPINNFHLKYFQYIFRLRRTRVLRANSGIQRISIIISEIIEHFFFNFPLWETNLGAQINGQAP